MTCREFDERIEAVVAGDESATDAFRIHVEECLRCAAAVASARRVEEGLATRFVATAPSGFTAAVIGRIRHERWQSEQHIDRLFNVALAAGVVLMVAGVLALMNFSGVAAAMAAGGTLMNQIAGRLVTEAAPVVSRYLLAGVFFLTALTVWWWAERSHGSHGSHG